MKYSQSEIRLTASYKAAKPSNLQTACLTPLEWNILAMALPVYYRFKSCNVHLISSDAHVTYALQCYFRCMLGISIVPNRDIRYRNLTSQSDSMSALWSWINTVKNCFLLFGRVVNSFTHSHLNSKFYCIWTVTSYFNIILSDNQQCSSVRM